MTTQNPAPIYDEASTLREARAQYFEHNGFGDGGYDAKWVELNKIGPIPVGFPNSAGRIRAVKIHDLHHVVTGYGTDYAGEAEIGAWELGAGCGRHYAAWVLNLGALGYGLFIAPKRVLSALARGRRSRSLYHHPELPESLLDRRVGEVRIELDLAREARPTTFTDAAALAGLWTAGMTLFLAPLAAVSLGLVALFR